MVDRVYVRPAHFFRLISPFLKPFDDIVRLIEVAAASINRKDKTR